MYTATEVTTRRLPSGTGGVTFSHLEELRKNLE
jgi:hypothetical protein